MKTAKQIWDDFCTVHQIADGSVRLFASDKLGFVETKEIGKKKKRRVLVRHDDMEKLILRETDILIKDWSQGTHQYDGLIYIMHQRGDDGCIVPLYIGKAETFGLGGKNLSANICDLHNRIAFYSCRAPFGGRELAYLGPMVDQKIWQRFWLDAVLRARPVTEDFAE